MITVFFFFLFFFLKCIMLVPYKFDSFNHYSLAGLLEMCIHKFKFYLVFGIVILQQWSHEQRFLVKVT